MATYTVDQNGNGDFSSIQAAIDAAAPDDIIEIVPGTYTEDVTLKSGVDIVGRGTTEADVVIAGTVTTPATYGDATVSMLTVVNAAPNTMLLDLRGTSAMTHVVFDHVTFSVTQPCDIANPPIGNGQGSGSINLIDGPDGDGAGLTFRDAPVRPSTAANRRRGLVSQDHLFGSVSRLAKSPTGSRKG